LIFDFGDDFDFFFSFASQNLRMAKTSSGRRTNEAAIISTSWRHPKRISARLWRK
jgi:hypothetical protein